MQPDDSMRAKKILGLPPEQEKKRRIAPWARVVMFGFWSRVIKPISRYFGKTMRYLAAKFPGPFYSSVLHLTLFILVVGIPFSCIRREVELPKVITAEILPITDATNLKKKSVPEPEKQEPPKPEPKKEEPKKEEPKKPEPKSEPKKPEPKPEPKKEEVKKPEPKKEEPKKPEPKKKEEKKKQEDSFESVLKTVEKLSESSKSEPEKTATESKTTEAPIYDETKPLSIAELDAVRSQISKCWSIPAGARDGQNMAVRISISLSQDGTVTDVKILDQSRYTSGDATFRAFADSARRAVLQCSPIQNMPADKYGSWKNIELNFDPKEMLN